MKNLSTIVIIAFVAVLFLLGYSVLYNTKEFTRKATDATRLYVDSLERVISELSVEITELKKAEALIREKIEENESDVISIYNKYKYLQSKFNNIPSTIDITEEDSTILIKFQNLVE